MHCAVSAGKIKQLNERDPIFCPSLSLMGRGSLNIISPAEAEKSEPAYPRKVRSLKGVTSFSTSTLDTLLLLTLEKSLVDLLLRPRELMLFFLPLSLPIAAATEEEMSNTVYTFIIWFVNRIFVINYCTKILVHL